MDDVLAMLLALSASPEELEVLMVSVTYGNVSQQRYISAPSNLAGAVHLWLTHPL